MLGPDGQPLEVVPIEKAGTEAWAGVAMLDDGERSQEFDTQSALLLAAGDVAALLVFALAGRANHGEGLGAETLATALPFIIGWFATSPFLGGFSADARKKGPATAALTAAKCWAAGIPLGLVLRGLSRGYVPPTPFILVSLGVTGVLLTGWRAALAAATKPEDPAAAKVRKNKNGNPFEFVELLMSLTKRW